jgi:hypothetical protein
VQEDHVKIIWTCAAVFAICVAAILLVLWDGRVFNNMTPSQHLNEAKRRINERDLPSLQIALAHVAAVAKTSPEAKEAAEVEAELKGSKAAIEQGINAAQLAKTSRATVIAQLQTDLNNLGYDLSVNDSDGAGEIAIRSSVFDDTEHRVRFLAFLRSRSAPTSDICLMGIRSIRLRGSGFLFGFNEAYPFSCGY